MTNITAQSEVTEAKTAQVPLQGFTLVEIDTTGINMDDPQAVLEAAKRQLPGVFKNGVDWRLDEMSSYE